MRLKIILLVGLCVMTKISLAQKLPQTGLASYYGKKFQGKKTANGEKFNMYAFTCAHRTLPFNTLLKVTNIDNDESVVVRVNDRGPHKKHRIIDLSKAAAEQIGLVSKGIGKVKVELANLEMMNEQEILLTKDCCHSQEQVIKPITGFNSSGKRFTDGDGIESEEKPTEFSHHYFRKTLSKVHISSIWILKNKKNRRGKYQRKRIKNAEQ